MLGSSPTAHCHRFKGGLACRRPGVAATRLNADFFFLVLMFRNDTNIKGILVSLYLINLLILCNISKLHNISVQFAGPDFKLPEFGVSQAKEFHVLKGCDGERPSNGRHASVLLAKGFGGPIQAVCVKISLNIRPSLQVRPAQTNCPITTEPP